MIFQSSNLIQKWILHDRNWEFFLVILQSSNLIQKLILHDRNWEFFLVRIFLLSDWIRRDTVYLSVFSLKAGKYGPEKTPYLDTFYEVGKTQQHYHGDISLVSYPHALASVILYGQCHYQKIKFFIKDFFSKCDQSDKCFPRIWSN